MHDESNKTIKPFLLLINTFSENLKLDNIIYTKNSRGK